MRGVPLGQLLAIAHREAGAHEAEDIVQDALIIAIEAGRHDLSDPLNAAWLRGVVRNKARMSARTSRRRRHRELRSMQPAPSGLRDDEPLAEILKSLTPALHLLACLVLSGHNRREIAYLLGLEDAALRQRVRSLKRHLVGRELAAPEELTGLNLDLAYGRIRDALLPALRRHGGVLASHDPDGHLFFVRRSQNSFARQ